MRVESAELFRYTLSLRKPLPLKNLTLLERKGFIVSITDAEGITGDGEIAPLPGWHVEDLAEEHNQLQEILPQFSDYDFPTATADLLIELRNRCKELKLYSSVRWGIETAMLQRQLRKRELSFAHLLGDNFQKTITVNALLTSSDPSIIDRALNFLSEGYNTFKIKVGRLSIEKEVEILKNLRSALGPEINIRLDANRSWSKSQAVQFGIALKNINVEYIEEPTLQIEQLAEFYRETGIPVALDESLNTSNPIDFHIPEGVKILVMKPSYMGGITSFLEWLKFVRKHQLYMVLSSTFESGFTLSILAELAALLNPGDRAMGLQTYQWLKEDLVEPPFTVVKGNINIKEIFSVSRYLNQAKLQSIEKFQF
jgi:o-succinylbenzoate synthase